jgi:hypothetical protein
MFERPRTLRAFRRQLVVRLGHDHGAASGGVGPSRRRGTSRSQRSWSGARDEARLPTRRGVSRAAPRQRHLTRAGTRLVARAAWEATRAAWRGRPARPRDEAGANCRGCARIYRRSPVQDQAGRVSVFVPANPVQTRRRVACRWHAAGGCAADTGARIDTGRSESGRSCGSGSCGD